MNLTGLLFTGTTSDGIRVMWKDNFESFYTEVAELGRWDSWEFIHTVLISHGFLYKNQSNIAIVLMLFLSLRGRFSVVKRCDQRGSKRTVAVKFVNKKLMKRDQVTHEFNVLQRLQHPHLVRLLDTFETSSSYALVLEMWELTFTHTHTHFNIRMDCHTQICMWPCVLCDCTGLIRAVYWTTLWAGGTSLRKKWPFTSGTF